MAVIEGQVQNGCARRWCILRTAGARTLPLAASLNAAGFDAWTPQLTIRRRRPRSKAMVELQAAILPTFVFLRSDRLDDLRRLAMRPGSALVQFSVLSHAGRVPLITDAQMATLRDEEDRAAAAHQVVKDREQRLAERSERQRKRATLRASAPSYAPGDQVRVLQPAFAGMTGFVERGVGKAVVVNLGGSISVTIEAWLLEPQIERAA